ncbi:MAG: hypothetical protein BIFFINMI_04114 [Phycisphaerae bacterium]|nr:hypothetical protein [Phycisphaerae bacterium]
MSESKVEEWLQGKGRLLGPLAVRLATWADAVVNLLEWARAGGVVPGQDGRPGPDGRTWARLYHRRIPVWRAVFESIPAFGADSPLTWEVFEGLLRVLRRAQNQPAVFQAEKEATFEEMRARGAADVAAGGQGLLADVMPEAWPVVLALLAWWNESGQDEPESVPGENRVMRAAFEKPEVLFFFRVWLPCWFEHGDFASRLMRQARLGRGGRALNDEQRAAKLAAVEKLLRVDAGAVCEPEIGRALGEAALGQGDKGGWKIRTAQRRRLPGRIDVVHTKAMLAGLVVQLSDLAHELLPVVLAMIPESHDARVREFIGDRIGAADMRGLYDAVAVDNGRSGPARAVDPDMVEIDANAWRVRVYRAKTEFWTYLNNPYKKLLGGM